ncbi:DUF4145 domain-containing protein [Enterococcus thailandicus]|uniref:DUF4145 domain-containing protein n=1 Tax=Enterococcus thailandicus TaxID=417368 RepID=UPI0025433320|nr:DUF4145 domain-containing protein [Enterococcus thailandicus]MDK4353513.1 DUF4145 domain-containing protein [Enterococcus thailandicus]MDT2734509.1 DUF4145 domain-containing protein [Enterococcus thailandicus]
MSATSYQCPFCNNYFPLNNDTLNYNFFSFRNQQTIEYYLDNEKSKVTDSEEFKDAVVISHLFCPACDKVSISIKGLGKDVKDLNVSVYPDSKAQHFPEYIPKGIKQDYEEACKIVNLSPKASATLARRCLQGMIRDFWDVQGKKNLYEEITAIQDQVTAEVSQVLKGLKDLGNIGAHMEKNIDLIIDIDPGEAEKLLKLIEYLIKEWYINRYESNKLFADIIGIDAEKKEQKKNGKV